MKAMLIKTERGLVGATPDDHAGWVKFRRKLETMKPGTFLRIDWSKPRNGKHHRKLFALLALVAENSEAYDTPEKALVAIKLVSGYCDPVIHPSTGKLEMIPHSISFESMDQDRFDKFYSAAIDGVLKHILPELDEQMAHHLMDMIVGGWA